MPSKCLPNSEWMSGSKEGAGEVREAEREGEKEKSRDLLKLTGH